MEDQRLAALRACRVLDTAPAESFDRLVGMAADLFEAPIALVSLIDADRQWFKARTGLEASETPREWAFCNHAIELGPHEVMVVEDARKDTRFNTSPLVVGSPDIRFYAGATLTTAQGHNLGTLCVIDTQSRKRPTEVALAQLKMLARVAVDQLELMRTKAECEEKSRLLELAEHMSGIGHWRLDLATAQVTWSDEVYRIHGVDRATHNPNLEAGIGFYHPDDQAEVRARIEETARTGVGFSFQLRLTRRDGELRDVLSKAVCERDATGKVTAIFGVFQDITEQTRVLNEIAQSESRYRLLADHSTDIIIRADRKGTLVYVSPSCRVLGYTPQELVGRSAASLVHEDDLIALFSHTAQLYERPDMVDRVREYRTRCKDGAWLWLEGNPTVVHNAAGEAIEIVNVFRDVTERHKINAALVEAKEAAAAAAAVKAEFLANMSHELRTPLTSIIGFSNLLREQPDLGEQARGFVERVVGASDALLLTVNDILDFSKLEAGQVEIKPRPSSPRELTSAALRLFDPQADAKGLALVLRAPPDLPGAVLLDSDRIRQILLNLVGNAVKFTDKGSVALDVRYDRAKQKLHCAVRDTGAGIAPEQLSRLFVRFSQVDGSSTRSHGGTGLGLAICKGLVEAMGGTIGAESTLGEGSRFWFEIPAPPLAAKAPERAPAARAAKLTDCRILAVDDNAANRALVGAIFHASGAELSLAASGAEALALAKAAPFDVILMDLHMPGMDGYATVKALRGEDGPNRHVAILAFTADADPALRSALVKVGFDGAVPKPVTQAVLFDEIAAVTQRDSASERKHA